MLEARAVCRRHGGRWVLQNFDLQATPGEPVALLGSNGAGKSTALRLLAGQLHADRGGITLNGEALSPARHRLRRRIGYLAQRPPLPGELAVRQAVNYAASAFRIPHRQRAAAVSGTLEKLGLEDLAGRVIRNLSHGQRQRAALAAALVHDPAIVILDEPSNGLDPEQAASLRALLQMAGEDRTLILATHLIDDVRTLCRRAVILREGRCVSELVASQWRRSMVVRLSRAPQAATLDDLPGVTAATALGEGLWALELSALEYAERTLAALLERRWGVEAWLPPEQALAQRIAAHSQASIA